MNSQNPYSKTRLAIAAAAVLFLSTFASYAQLKIGLPAGTAAASAILDASNTGGGNQGFLAPSVALTAINSAGPVTSPATGLLVYNTATAGTAPNNVVPGFYYWNASQWVKMVVTASSATDGNIYANDGSLAGNRMVTMAANTLTFNGSSGTTLAMNAGKVGIGVTAPTTQLQVAGSFSTNYQTPNACGCVVSGVSDVPVTTSHFTMFNGNFTNTATLPSGATEGQRMIMSSGAQLSYTISTTNTNLASALTVANGQAYQFVFVNGIWIRVL